MAWTAPSAPVAGVVALASWMTTNVINNLKAIGDPWTSYTPTWAGGAPALGNGTLVGAYVAAGKLIHYRIKLTAGSTTTYGGASWTFTLPVAANAAYVANSHVGGGSAYDVSAAAVYGLTGTYSSGAVALVTSANAFVGSTVPFTWANTDVLTISGTYEAA